MNENISRASQNLSHQNFQTAGENKYFEGVQHAARIMGPKDNKENSDKKIENIINRTKQIMNEQPITSNNIERLNDFNVQPMTTHPQTNTAFPFDFENLNNRVEHALRRSEINLKKSGVFYIKRQENANSSNEANNYDVSLFNFHDVKDDNRITPEIEIKFKSLSSPKNALKLSTAGRSIDIVFNEALKRSESLLKQNENIERNPPLFQLNLETKMNNFPASQHHENRSNLTSSRSRTPAKEKNLHILKKRYPNNVSC